MRNGTDLSCFCRLCRNRDCDFAKSHILPRAFFKCYDMNVPLFSIGTNGQGRTLRKQLYDKQILCEKCEHGILAPLDDYGFKVYGTDVNWNCIDVSPFSDRRGVRLAAIRYVDKNKNEINRRRLRAFVASLLWRCAVSELKEFIQFTIDENWQERIRQDLLRGGEFEYIDAITYAFTSEVQRAIIMPIRTHFEKNGKEASGVILQMPKLEFRVTYDGSANPYDFGRFDLSQIGGSGHGSMSLSDSYTYDDLILFQAEKKDYHEKELKVLWERHQHARHTHGRGVKDEMR